MNMSNTNDETLLEVEDGEDEYDLGNEEEEALLADDCDTVQELSHGNLSYLKKTGGRKGMLYSDKKIYRESEEPPEDDILDLDDFESDILDNTEYTEEGDYTEAQVGVDPSQHEDLDYSGEVMPMASVMDDDNNNAVGDQDMINQEGGSGGDMEEHMHGQTVDEDVVSRQRESEDEEEEDDKEDGEGRGRFKSERTTMISLKGNKEFGNIPDTLDGLITNEEKQEVGNRWKKSGRGGFSRGNFRGNQRGFGPNFGQRRKQMMGQGRQGNQNIVFPHQRVEGSSEPLNSLLPGPFITPSHKIHINPHFRGNVHPQPDDPLWNDNAMGNLQPSNSGGPPPQFHDAPRFPPPMGFGNLDPRDVPSNMMDHHRQQRQRTPPSQNPFHSGDRGSGFESGSPVRFDFHRDQVEQNHVPVLPEAWMNPQQRLQEGSIGPPGGHHHQFGGNHQHFPSNVHNDRSSGEVLQHFRPTIQPGPLFSHVASVAPPTIPQQNLLMQQQHLQNILRSAPPLHNAGIGQMLQLPPQEPHNRIPPPGFSPNDGRSLQHGPPSPWQEQQINRSPMAGQQMSIIQQQHPGFHQGGLRSFPAERGGNLQGVPLHHIPHSAASMSAPPPPFHAGNMPQGPPPHPMHQQHPHQGQLRQNSFNPPPSVSSNRSSGPSGHQNNGRFPRQGSGNFQSPGFSRNPQNQQGPRPTRGGGHMGSNRGGLGQRRGMAPNIRSSQIPKQVSEEGFPPKRPSMEVPPQVLKPSPPKKRKMRKIVKSNLHEVETVDTLPDTTTISDKETPKNEKELGQNKVETASTQPEDAALLEYQKKIEQQKLLRERILQEKEQRRKFTALQKQKELQEKAALSESNDIPKGNAIATIVNRNPVEPSPSTAPPAVKKEPVLIPPFSQPSVQSNELSQPQLIAARKKALQALKNARSQNPVNRPMIGRGMAMRGIGPRGVGNQQIRPPNPGAVGNVQVGTGTMHHQGGQRFKIIQIKNESGQLIRKKAPIRPGIAGRGTVIGRGQILEVNSQQIRPIGQGRGNVTGNKVQQMQMTGGGHRLVQVLSTAQQGHHLQDQESKVVLQRVVKQAVPGPPPQIQGRKVVVQNLGGSGDSGSVEGGSVRTHQPCTVIVENLAASTSEAELRKMCQSVGRVLNVQMVPSHRRAMIEFAHPSYAATFFQRYQRKIVDLSMISVRLANS